MFVYWLTLLISLLFINIHADINKSQHGSIIVAAEQQASDTFDGSGKHLENSIINNRRRRELYSEAEEIWGMAKKVAITVFVLVSLCIVCCLITTITILVKCCCGGNNNRKRDQGFNSIPQPIIIHTSSPHYPPAQYHQQQAPTASPLPAQIWHPENHPMLPAPSAPPQPNDDSYMERPPPYEKICAS